MLHKISVVPALTLNAYTAADNVGGLLTFTVSSASEGSTGGKIKGLVVQDAAVQDEEYFLHLYNASPAAAAITDADACVQVAADIAKKLVTFHIAAADYLTSAGDSIASYEKDTPIVFDGKAIYGVLECVATPDYVAADDLTVTLYLEG